MKVPKAKKLPSGLYSVQVRVGGHSKTFTGKHKDDVTNQALLYKAQYANGLIQIDKPKGLTLREMITGYIASKDNILDESTLRAYEAYQRNRFQAVMDVPVTKDMDWQTIVNAEAKQASAKYLKNVWSLVHASLKRYGYNVDNVTLPTVIKHEARFLDPEDVARFISAIKGTDIELVCLLALHSLRRSEIMALDRKDIKLDKQSGRHFINVKGAVIMNRKGKYIHKDTNKTVESQRRIPVLIPRLLELLKPIKSGRLYKGDPVNMYKKINRFCDEHGFERMGHHGFRHSFVVLCFEAELSVYTVQRLGGWKTPNTVNDIYNHLSERQKLDAFDKVADVLKRYSNE